MKYLNLLVLLSGWLSVAYGQHHAQEKERKGLAVNTRLFKMLKVNDSLIFTYSFESCDAKKLAKLIDDDFEFYHDQGGITPSKEEFLKGLKNLCNLPYRPVRELVDESLRVFPLYKNGKLYGAIQKGIHNFYAIEKDKPKYLTSTAKFTHLWINTENRWQLKRVLSYDHYTPKK